MKFLKELISRWKSDIPSFWKKVRSAGLLMAGVGLAMLGVNTTLSTYGLSLSGWELEIGKDLLLIGTVISSCAQITKTDSSDEKNN